MINAKKITNLLHTIKKNIQPQWNTLFEKTGRGPKFLYQWWTFIVAQAAFLTGKFEDMSSFVRFFGSDDPGAKRLRNEAGLNHRFPDRTTFERRMERLPSFINDIMTAQSHVMESCGVISSQGRMLDTTPTLARGNVWHKKQKQKGIIPKGLRNIDKDAEWGWATQYQNYYGYKTGIYASLFPVPVPISYRATRAPISDTAFFPPLTESLVPDNLFLLADGSYDVNEYDQECLSRDILLVTKIGRTPAEGAMPERHALYDFLKTEEGKKLYQLRSGHMERLNSLIKNLFPQLRKAIVKGLHRISSSWGAALLLYQTAVFQNFVCRRPLEYVKSQIF